jgi:hypothetical protein
MNSKLVRIRSYKNKQLYNLYYNKAKNEFYVKKSENTNFCIPLRWKHVHRWYINKRIMRMYIKYIVMLISIIHKQKRKCVLLKRKG